MTDPSLSDLDAFIAVAQTRSFRHAATLRNVSASSLSEAVRRLEARLGVRLLNRTTRSVTPTEAGQRLLARLTPAFAEVAAALDAVNSFRESPTRHIAAQCADDRRQGNPAADRRHVFSQHIPASCWRSPRMKLCRRPCRRLRRRNPLRGTPRAGHDRDPDRAAQATLRGGRVARPISPGTARRNIRATCFTMPASGIGFASGVIAADWEFERGERGGPYRAGRPADRLGHRIGGGRRLWRTLASSQRSRNFCGRRSSAANSCRCSTSGGRASRGRFSTIPAGTCPRPCAPLSTSSANIPAGSRKQRSARATNGAVSLGRRVFRIPRRDE